MARRDAGAYWAYSTEEQHSPRRMHRRSNAAGLLPRAPDGRVAGHRVSARGARRSQPPSRIAHRGGEAAATWPRVRALLDRGAAVDAPEIDGTTPAPLGGPPRRRRHGRSVDPCRGGRDGGQPVRGGAGRAGEPQRQRADAGQAAGGRGRCRPRPAGGGDRADDRGPHGAGRGGPAPARSRRRRRRGRAVAGSDRADVGRGRGGTRRPSGS